MTNKTIWFDLGTLAIVEKFMKKTGHTMSRANCVMIQLYNKYQEDIEKATQADQAFKALDSYRDELHKVQIELQDLKKQLEEKK